MGKTLRGDERKKGKGKGRNGAFGQQSGGFSMAAAREDREQRERREKPRESGGSKPQQQKPNTKRDEKEAWFQAQSKLAREEVQAMIDTGRPLIINRPVMRLGEEYEGFLIRIAALRRAVKCGELEECKLDAGRFMFARPRVLQKAS